MHRALLSAALIALATPFAVQAQTVTAPIKAALADASRPEADKARDAARREACERPRAIAERVTHGADSSRAAHSARSRLSIGSTPRAISCVHGSAFARARSRVSSSAARSRRPSAA